MDINTFCLDHAKQRVARLNPETVRANVIGSIKYPGCRFDSIAVTCLPSSMPETAVLFDHLISLLHPGSVIFGATIVNGVDGTSWLARKLMNAYNQKRIFCNALDTRERLETEFRSRFSSFETQTVGGIVLFSAHV